VPVHHAGEEKSSLAMGVPVLAELVLLEFVELELLELLELFELPFRLPLLLATWLELLELFLLVFELMLASTPMTTAAPIPKTTSKPMPPKTQGSALFFFGAP
jgi:hypothetical protein